ncbi:2-dehydro-3-deoxygalactonokinase [Sphingomonas sp. ID1715]|uniref:2-dehydro-3-deoxygalactonokinase n=1 Tax=Sphingomonas sp. ID1715 TaxID=1656898 RepID=UPI0014893B5C|nr:2-dehydro-3-deoxygalactonokinase [Sphingomonas sp. ID1715]NNM75883.1 2-dehydro-3-deoxygalactonokinase [Sphingomonas sp. ID1715]
MAGRKDWAQGFIAVDWGTTNRRAWAVAADQPVRPLLEDGMGVLKVPPGGYTGEIDRLRALWPGRPLLLAGMIGSNRGWVEAPYVPASAGLDALVASLRRPAEDVVIVPGVSWLDGREADVMRGEEVQLLGAVAAGLAPADGVICHPGTHAKWVRMLGGAIGPFRSVMTGELFSMLSRHGILQDRLAGEVTINDDFRAGAEHGLSRTDLTAELFSVRARFLLRVREDSASYVSGLLIGSDVRIGLERFESEAVTLIGRSDLTALYAEALRLAGRTSSQVDGEPAFLLGAQAIAERL